MIMPSFDYQFGYGLFQLLKSKDCSRQCIGIFGTLYGHVQISLIIPTVPVLVDKIISYFPPIQ
jgi:hypothetical protein